MWTWEIWFCPSSAIYWHGEGETTNPQPLHACGFWESWSSQEQKNCPCSSQAIELRRVSLHIEIPPYWRYTKAKLGEVIKIASIWKTLVNYKCPVLLWCHTCLVALGNGSLHLTDITESCEWYNARPVIGSHIWLTHWTTESCFAMRSNYNFTFSCNAHITLLLGQWTVCFLHFMSDLDDLLHATILRTMKHRVLSW